MRHYQTYDIKYTPINSVIQRPRTTGQEMYSHGISRALGLPGMHEMHCQCAVVTWRFCLERVAVNSYRELSTISNSAAAAAT